MQTADARGGERGQEQRDHLGVAADAGFAEELGADLRDLARLPDARGRAQHAAGIAEAGDPGLVQQVRIDPRDLRRDVGAHAEEPSRHRVDDLERLQVEIASRSGQERIEVLDERRLHQPVAVPAEVIEQEAAKRLDPLGLRRQDILDPLRKDPLTHCARARRRRRRARSRRAR